MKLSYPNAVRSQIRNDRLERCLRESSRREVASGFRARAARRDDRVGPGRLGLERRDREPHELGRNTLPLEVVADQEIARAARRELLRPLERESPVVDQAGPLCRLDGVTPNGRRTVPRAASRCSSDAAVWSRARSARSAAAWRSSRRSSRPSSRAVGRSSVPTDHEPRTVDRLERHDAPRRAVELDGDTPGPRARRAVTTGTTITWPWGCGARADAVPATRSEGQRATPRPPPLPRPLPRPRSA